MNLRETIGKYFKGDGVIWAVILILSILSVLVVYSSTGTLAYRHEERSLSYFVLKHAGLLFLGGVIIFITHRIPYRIYSRLSLLLLAISAVMLLITLIMGVNLNEASRWIKIPGLGLTIQTSDFAKLALIMYIARVLSVHQEDIMRFKFVFWYLLLPIFVVCMLIMPANLSTALILMVTSMMLLFVGRVPLKHLVLVGGGSVLILIIIIGGAVATGDNMRVGTWQNRIENYVTGEGGDSYQSDQSKIAIASGGFLGKGPGNSTQRNFLPHPYSDFIFAIIVEEYGFLGGLVIVALYMFLLYRAGLVVRKSKRAFGAFLAMGLTLSLSFQALINMGVAVGILPVTGQPLPLVSMGGTSLLFTGVALGIILNVSRSVELEQNA
ncbi:MAG: FtsW/RodA/SpoVE family cell cycle protein [Bacteroidales bacterium]